jgi:hypothetical protein
MIVRIRCIQETCEAFHGMESMPTTAQNACRSATGPLAVALFALFILIHLYITYMSSLSHGVNTNFERSNQRVEKQING